MVTRPGYRTFSRLLTVASTQAFVPKILLIAAHNTIRKALGMGRVYKNG